MVADSAAGNTEAQFKDVLKLPTSKSQTLEGYQNLIDQLNVIIKLQYSMKRNICTICHLQNINFQNLIKSRMIFIKCKYLLNNQITTYHAALFIKHEFYKKNSKYSVCNY